MYRKMQKAPANNSEETIGIIAGSGDLPRFVISSLQEKGKRVFVIAIENCTEYETVSNIPHIWIPMGKIGAAIKALKSENANKIIMAGRVGRPEISSLRLDVSGLRLLIKLRQLRLQGDDVVFSTIIKFFEEANLKVIGIDEILPELLTAKGVIGNIKPDKVAEKDIELGKKVALEIGKLDIGQAVITQNGRVLAVEGAEGTDEMIRRARVLHDLNAPGGVLIKVKKPGQDARVDLPSIGVKTIENINESGLRGIALEAGGSLIIDRENVIRKADSLGIFLVGI